MAELTREQLLMAIIAGRGPAYLRGINLSKLDLSNAGWLVEADLRETNLSDTNLSGANLKGSKLEGSNLRKANCMRANLEGADLSGANLNVVNLQLANLRNANLQSASLVGANLAGANLAGASLAGAKLDGANLDRVNFDGASFEELPSRERILGSPSSSGVGSISVAPAPLVAEEEVELTTMEVEVIEEEEGEPGFYGKLNNIQLTDLIQMICLSKSDFTIRVKSSQGVGVIYIRSGQISHGQAGDLQGEKALFEMLRWSAGTFETIVQKEKGMVSISKPWEHLLIEGMRQRDENQEGAGQVSQGFTGIVKDIQLTDLIQMVCLSRADLLVSIQSNDQTGTIYIRSGQLSHAQSGTLQGEKAVFEMLRWDSGRFETVPYEGSGVVSINKPWEHLLIEGMRQRDEKRG